MSRERAIGAPVPRKDGQDKVAGAAVYADDIHPEGVLHGVTVRSPAPRGRVTGVHFGGGVPWDEITVVTAADIPGKNVVTLMAEDQPFLADGVVNHPEEPVLLLAHEDPYLLEEARRLVRVEVEPLPPALTIAESRRRDPVVWGEDNVLHAIDIDKGDVDPVFSQPGVVVVEGEYETGAQEQLYIECQAMLAEPDGAGGVIVRGSLQCPYYIHKALMPLLDLPPERVRVIQTTTGGGFGGKEEYPSLIAGHAALLALQTGRPVKIVYDRAEDMAATTKRHPSWTRHRTALAPDGRLLAMEVDFYLDGGAYVTLSPVVLSRGAIHAAGPYRCDHVRVRARAVATNTPPHGAFRGFGAPQSIFALERHLDVCAGRLGLDPAELRRRNLLRPGDSTATSHVIEEPIDLHGLLDDALQRAGWAERRAAFEAENARPGATVRRGVGLATFFHGAGFTGSGEAHMASEADVELTATGRARVLAASTEIGQGARTIFAQIAADALGLPYDQVDVPEPDTAEVPDSGPTVASRTTMVVGGLVQRAAAALRRRLVDAGYLDADGDAGAVAEAARRHVAERGPLKERARYEPPPGVVWDEKRYRGAAYATYAWAAYVAQVAVDTVTWEARVEDFVAVQDIGGVVHPVLAEGQVEGGVAQGIGLALYEEVRWREGRMANNRMTNYIMPTAADLPPIRVAFRPLPYAAGPGGAKGLGELPMDGPAPAVANAVAHALGLPFNRVPIMPEAMLAAAARAAGDPGEVRRG